MATGRFGSRGEYRLVQFVRELQPLGKMLGRRPTAIAVFAPGRSVEIAAHDALDRYHFGAADDHRPSVELFPLGVVEAFDGREVCRHQVVGGVEEVEEVKAEPGEHAAFVGDQLREDHVICGDAIGCDKKKVVGVDLVDLPHLAGGDV